MEYQAVSKLNLYLKVTGRRPDGYHCIESVFVPVDFVTDKISLEFSENGESCCVCCPPILPEGEKNLAVRAALEYFKATGIDGAVKIKLKKNIPLAAGMGGGSSDAAAVLLLLEKRFSALGEGRLHDIALRLGADVPFFLNPGAADVKGIGEDIKILDFPVPEIPLLVVNPLFPVSAAWAYCNLESECKQPDKTNRKEAVIDALREQDWEKLAANIHNDLARPLYRKFPLLSLLRDFMESNGAMRSEITGSGPTLYALLKPETAAPEMEYRLKEKFGENSIRCFYAGKNKI